MHLFFFCSKQMVAVPAIFVWTTEYVATEVTTLWLLLLLAFFFFFLPTVVTSNNSTSARCSLPAEPVKLGVRTKLKNEKLPWRGDGCTLGLRLWFFVSCFSIYRRLCDCWCRLWLSQSGFGSLRQLSGAWKPVSGKWEQCIYRSLKHPPRGKKLGTPAGRRLCCCWWPKALMQSKMNNDSPADTLRHVIVSPQAFGQAYSNQRKVAKDGETTEETLLQESACKEAYYVARLLELQTEVTISRSVASNAQAENERLSALVQELREVSCSARTESPTVFCWKGRKSVRPCEETSISFRGLIEGQDGFRVTFESGLG